MANAAAGAQRRSSTASSAGSAPSHELFEQLVALAFRDRARTTGRDLPLCQKLIELIAALDELLIAPVPEPFVDATEALPTRNDSSEIGVLPLRVPRRLLEIGDLLKEGFDELVDAAVAIGVP